MKKLFVAAALATALVQPAAAITFSKLTTIYIGGGVIDDGGASNAGVATSFVCTNVSGLTASIRFLVLNTAGQVVAQQTINDYLHGVTLAGSTHFTGIYPEANLATGGFFVGAVNIESTQSAVFCSAMIVHAGSLENLTPLRLVRINPHPGSVE